MWQDRRLGRVVAPCFAYPNRHDGVSDRTTGACVSDAEHGNRPAQDDLGKALVWTVNSLMYAVGTLILVLFALGGTP